jgi:hypothetical protein
VSFFFFADDADVALAPPVPGEWPPAVGREPFPEGAFPPKATGTQPGPPQNTCWSSKGDFKWELPAGIPTKPDRRYHRGNFSGVSVKGFTNGNNDKDRSLVITWEIPACSVADQELIIWFLTVVCGHTHIVLSIPQARNWGVSRQQLIECALRCKKAGLFISMIAVSDGNAFDVAIPWLQAMVDAGALVSGQDLVCCCWQVDRYYGPMAVVDLVKANGAWSHPRGLLTTIHWGGGYEGWAQSCAIWDEETTTRWGIHDRYSFQAVLKDKLDGHYGQCNTEAEVDEKQSWLRKALVAMPEPMFLVAMETNAQGRYGYPNDPNGDWSGPIKRPEVWCDMDGYLMCCVDRRISWGNGARLPKTGKAF